MNSVVFLSALPFLLVKWWKRLVDEECFHRSGSTLDPLSDVKHVSQLAYKLSRRYAAG